MMRFASSSLALLALASLSASAPIMEGDIIPGRYIVMFDSDVSANQLNSMVDSVSSMESGNSKIDRVYNLGGFKGFSGAFDEAALNALKSQESGLIIEPDRVMRLSAVQDAPPSWGLARVGSDQTDYDTNKYEYPDAAGAGVTAYVIDTGCLNEHEDFEGRATLGQAFGYESSLDGNGHGTHVAATIAGKSFGVAKKAKVVCVKVLSDQGSGSFSDVIAGIQWVAEDAKDKKAVANMSLGGSKSAAIDRVVQEAIKSGVTFVVAAGNERRDACRVSPANVPEAITVAASTRDNQQASFSNFGKCVDVYAPGKDITSAWIDSNSATKTISGTSMASPHVAGIAALYLSVHLAGDSNLTPDQMSDALFSNGVKDAIKNPTSGTKNVIAYANLKL